MASSVNLIGTSRGGIFGYNRALMPLVTRWRQRSVVGILVVSVVCIFRGVHVGLHSFWDMDDGRFYWESIGNDGGLIQY
jgi:hypothetical protein